MNRFIINLKSLSTAGSSQGSSAQHWSRFSPLNFHIPDLSLGNIGEDLQDSHESADSDHGEDQEMHAMFPNTQGSPEAKLAERSAAQSSSSSRQMNAQVIPRIHSMLKPCDRTLSRLGCLLGQPFGLWNTNRSYRGKLSV